MTTDEIRDEQRRDCFIVRDGHWFRFRVAAVILRDGCVLMAHNVRDSYYYSVGGAVMLGESAEQAIRREVLEETGIAMEPERLLFIHENFFPGHNGLRCHEVAFYYLMHMPEDAVIAASSHNMYGDAEWVEWVPLKDYASMNAYPLFFATHLVPLPQQTMHIVTHEEESEEDELARDGTEPLEAVCPASSEEM